MGLQPHEQKSSVPSNADEQQDQTTQIADKDIHAHRFIFYMS